MCEPATIMMAMSSIASGMAAQQQSNYDAGVSTYNARRSENEATQTRNKGVEEENTQRQKTAQLLSEQRAQLGASGVSLASGSPLQLQEDTELLGEIDARRIKSNYDLQAQSLDDEAGLQLGNASAQRTAGNNAMFGSALGAAGSALGAAGSVASTWYTPSSSAFNPLTVAP
jgi:hypothetical protein